MIDAAHVPAVDADELLARFVLQRSHIRSDGTVRSDAFIPPPNRELSVTRHVSATEAEIWAVGQNVAAIRQKPLQGRADVRAKEYSKWKLSVREAPIAGNANHANVVDWPEEKSAQKLIAQEIAAMAQFVTAPPVSSGG